MATYRMFFFVFFVDEMFVVALEFNVLTTVLIGKVGVFVVRGYSAPLYH